MTEHQHADRHQRVHERGDLQDHDDLPDLLDLDAEVLQTFTATLTEWVAETVGTPPRHVLDLGSGTGAGVFALLERFPGVRVTALDSSSQMLGHLRRRAAAVGRDEQVTVLEADLDDGLPQVDGVDLVWASSSVHHLNDPDRLLADVAGLLPVGGWFAIVEMEDVPWFLPDELGIGRPGLETRCHELLSRHRAAQMPYVGSDWGARLASTDLVVRAARMFDVDVPAPVPEPARRYAHALISRLRQAARGRLDADDLATLDVLLDDTDPRSLSRREDLTVRATRRAWAAQRPGPEEEPT